LTLRLGGLHRTFTQQEFAELHHLIEEAMFEVGIARSARNVLRVVPTRHYGAPSRRRECRHPAE
jgi:hypothetical protein